MPSGVVASYNPSTRKAQQIIHRANWLVKSDMLAIPGLKRQGGRKSDGGCSQHQPWASTGMHTKVHVHPHMCAPVYVQKHAYTNVKFTRKKNGKRKPAKPFTQKLELTAAAPGVWSCPASDGTVAQLMPWSWPPRVHATECYQILDPQRIPEVITYVP